MVYPTTSTARPAFSGRAAAGGGIGGGGIGGGSRGGGTSGGANPPTPPPTPSRPELRFPLALFRALVNPADEIAFVSAASHSCVAGMGDLTLQTLQDIQRERQASQTAELILAKGKGKGKASTGSGGSEKGRFEGEEGERLEEEAADYTLADAARDALVEGMVRGRAATALRRFMADFGRWREMLLKVPTDGGEELMGGSTSSALLSEILYVEGKGGGLYMRGGGGWRHPPTHGLAFLPSLPPQVRVGLPHVPQHQLARCPGRHVLKDRSRDRVRSDGVSFPNARDVPAPGQPGPVRPKPGRGLWQFRLRS